MKISITGDLGSGKSTVAKQLAKDLGFDYISTGTIFREIAKEYGIDVLKLNKLALTDTSIDDRVDGKLKEYNQHPTGLIIDSRLAWHFINESIKIICKEATVIPLEILGLSKDSISFIFYDMIYNICKSAFSRTNNVLIIDFTKL